MMKMDPKIRKINPDEVDQGWRVRATIDSDVNGLAGSIAAEGQISPITVTPKSGGYALIAGSRRLAACKQLGIDVKASIVHLDGAEHLMRVQLAENTQRADFDPLEMGSGLKAWKKLYEQKYPETTAGGARKKGEKNEGAVRFTLAASRLLSCSEGKVKEYLAIAELPKRDVAKAQKARTRRERDAQVRALVKDVRQRKKKEKLREQAKKAGETDGRQVIHLCPNDQFFATEEGSDGRFDLCLTDVPYGQRQSLIAHSNRKSIDTNFGGWDKLDIGWTRHLSKAMAKNSQVLIFCPFEGIAEYKFALETIGFEWKGVIVWHKTNPGTVHRPAYLSSCEAIVWATRGKYYMTPWDNAGDAEVHNFVEGPICGGNERLNHPTQKPEWIIRRLIERHAHENSQVLDPFAGVGTTAAVCRRLGIACHAVEMDRDYAGQALLRLKAISVDSGSGDTA